MSTQILQIVTAFAGSFGFALVFGIRKRYSLLVALDGALSWTVYLLCMNVMSSFFSNLAAAVFCQVYAAVLARLIKVPTTVLLMPATVPMIPGGSLYYTIHYLMLGMNVRAMGYAAETVKTVFALAVGFAVVTTLLDRHQARLRMLFREDDPAAR